ncbi:MAG: cell division protein FtsZ, partial [Desulfovibrionales bacterium]|nr:cell division protein FtsZ [Desulfovibrionales bacterium]
MFIKADEILHHSVKGITDLITRPGHINLDFADVKTTMKRAGKALMGIGIASGENRAVEAAEKAIRHPLLEDISIEGAKGVLMNITATQDLTLEEAMAASDRIYEEVGDEAEIIWGQTFDEELGDEMRITVIATGIGDDDQDLTENIHQLDPRAGRPAAPAQQPGYQSRTMAYGASMGSAAVDTLAMETNATSQEPVARGQVRTPTDEELANWNERENPVTRVISKQKLADPDPVPEFNLNGYDEDDLDTPTFLRRKAD